MKGKTNNYQMILVFAPKTAADLVDKVLAKVANFLEKFEAKIEKKENLGTKELVYDIKKQRKGDFWELTLGSVKPFKMTEMNIFLNREVSVIRYLILKN